MIHPIRKLTAFMILLSALATLPIASSAHAGATGYGTRGAGDFGLGIFLGEPTAITGKYWLSDRNAVDATVGSSVGDVTVLTASYLLHFPNLLGRPSQFVKQLSAYAGIGGILGFERGKESGLGDKDVALGAKAPFGIEWVPVNPPVGVFVELWPALIVVPDVGWDVFGGVGIRYYF